MLAAHLDFFVTEEMFVSVALMFSAAALSCLSARLGHSCRTL